MTKFEKRFKHVKNLKGFILYTSLEPCPMCLARLIPSGVKRIYYAAVDRDGGMVHRLKYFPPVWIKLAQGQEFALAQCSPELRDIALQIFLTTVNENNRKL
jgi:cytosine deaminase